MRAALVMLIVIGACTPAPPIRAQQPELASLWQDHRVGLVFYRGHWCPYCQHQLILAALH